MTAAPPPWTFAEFDPVGVDLDSATAVAAYDTNQGTRAAADDELLDRLAIGADSVIVDLGTGTGSLPVQAAKRGAEAHGVDVSTTMLEFARNRAQQAGVEIHIHHGGFLSHQHQGPPADVVTTRSALHQLPDTWKQIALVRLHDMLRPGGVLYLWDAMWSCAPAETPDCLADWIDTMARTDGTGFTREDFETHVREEFSTYGWILEEMIERAGFEGVESNYPSRWYGEIIARRPG
ncbi:MAG: class I SAM-dependent methyltransferase [Acidimicrobiales bacterium]